MLFNSFVFLFAFLPLALLGFHLTSTAWGGAPAARLADPARRCCSTAGGRPDFMLLLVLSILATSPSRSPDPPRVRASRPAAAILTIGIAGDLAALFYFKYLYAC